MYSSCSLYALQSKKMLCSILDISDKRWLKKGFVQQNIHPYIDTSKKPRLIEVPNRDLKLIQRRIKNYLLKCNFPEYVFSGVKSKSYIDNAKIHRGNQFIFKIDISSFFPNTTREKVFCFFKDELKTSPDVANCLSNFCTSDLSYISQKENNSKEHDTICAFLKAKKIRHMNHLCTGASPSPVLSYLVNQCMFNEMMRLCSNENITMTIYIDDVVFSSMSPISKEFRERIIKTVTKNGYNISNSKVKYYTKYNVKKVTGVIIKPDGTIDVPNKLRYKVIKSFNNGMLTEEKNVLQGCIIAARQIRNVFPNILRCVKFGT